MEEEEEEEGMKEQVHVSLGDRAPRPSTTNLPLLDARPQPPACISYFPSTDLQHLETAIKPHPSPPQLLFLSPGHWVIVGGWGSALGVIPSSSCGLFSPSLQFL